MWNNMIFFFISVEKLRIITIFKKLVRYSHKKMKRADSVLAQSDGETMEAPRT